MPIDVTDMYAVHQVFRDTLAAAPGLLSDESAAAPDRAALLADFYANVLAFLDVHHQGEDLLLFPLLLDRCPSDTDTINRIAAQHHDVTEILGSCKADLAAWQAGDDNARITLGDHLGQLGVTMTEHLDDEEQQLLPLCAEAMTPPEWGQLPAHGSQHFAGNKIWLIWGMILARFSPAQRDAMLEHMPPPALDMWTSFGEASYNELIAQVGAPLG